jgi:hypothetical protein
VSAAVVRGLIVLGAVLVLGAVNFSIQGRSTSRPMASSSIWSLRR